MLRAASIAYLALGGFTLLYVVFVFAVTDRGVLGAIMAVPIGIGLWCLAMGAWSAWMVTSIVQGGTVQMRYSTSGSARSPLDQSLST